MVECEPIYANMDILSQQNDYFVAMFRCSLRERERVLTVPECSKAAFFQLLSYLYMDGFSVSVDDHVVELWAFTDMYQLEGLKLY